MTSVIEKIHRSNKEDTTNTTDDFEATLEEEKEGKENRDRQTVEEPVHTNNDAAFPCNFLFNIFFHFMDVICFH